MIVNHFIPLFLIIFLLLKVILIKMVYHLQLLLSLQEIIIINVKKIQMITLTVFLLYILMLLYLLILILRFNFWTSLSPDSSNVPPSLHTSTPNLTSFHSRSTTTSTPFRNLPTEPQTTPIFGKQSLFQQKILFFSNQSQ